jgi:hypothetical protein
MAGLYRYVGPKRILDRVKDSNSGLPVKTPEDVRRWVRDTRQALDPLGRVTATFVVDETGILRIADRRSEHVVCAGGKPVRSAGEITFVFLRSGTAVDSVTNQSTGYCPEPESWPAVEAALEQAGFSYPSGFSQEFVFRRCVRCNSINIIKDGVFECAVCSSPLPVEWNLASSELNDRAGFSCTVGS